MTWIVKWIDDDSTMTHVTDHPVPKNTSQKPGPMADPGEFFGPMEAQGQVERAKRGAHATRGDIGRNVDRPIMNAFAANNGSHLNEYQRAQISDYEANLDLIYAEARARQPAKNPLAHITTHIDVRTVTNLITQEAVANKSLKT